MSRPLLFGSAVLATIVVAACRSSENQYAPPPPPTVTVASPIRAELPDFFETSGTTEAVDVVEVRSRVRGFIERISPEAGAEVAAGDLLYEIEKDEYQVAREAAAAEVQAAAAAIATATASVAAAQAELESAQASLGREQELMRQNATSQAALDLATAAVATANAAVDAAKAQVEVAEADEARAEQRLADAELNLGYTDITAPIAGRITKTEVKLGNLIDVGALLATIVNPNEIYVNFSSSDRELLEYRLQRRSEGAAELSGPDVWAEFEVLVGRGIDAGFPFVGMLNYVDQQGVDEETGTVGLRAKLENGDGQLVPGLFVKVRIPNPSNESSLLIPETAIARDQLGSYVMVVVQEEETPTAKRQNITVSRRVEGWAVVQRGLTEESMVIVRGIQKARPDAPVTVAQEATLTIDMERLERGLAGQPLDDLAPMSEGVSGERVPSEGTSGEDVPSEDVPSETAEGDTPAAGSANPPGQPSE